MFYKTLLWLAYFSCGTCALVRAQQAEDYLQPADDYFSSYGHINEYYPQVRKLLFAGLSNTPIAQVVVLPSFSPEYVLSIEQKEENSSQHYYLTYRVGQQSIWNSLQVKSGQNAVVSTRTTELPAAFAKALANLFNTALLQTHYPPPASSLIMRTDGTIYTFAAFQYGIGMRGGSTWSPQENTKMGRLVSIVAGLVKIAGSDNSQKFQTALLTQTLQLTEQLQTP